MVNGTSVFGDAIPDGRFASTIAGSLLGKDTKGDCFSAKRPRSRSVSRSPSKKKFRPDDSPALPYDDDDDFLTFRILRFTFLRVIASTLSMILLNTQIYL